MNGGHFAKFRQAFKLRTLFALIFNGVVIGGVFYYLAYQISLETEVVLMTILGVTIITSTIVGAVLSKVLLSPTEAVAQAIFHISPNEHFVQAPNIDSLRFGKELVQNLTRQIYDYASAGQAVPAGKSDKPTTGNLDQLDEIPLCVVGINKDGEIALINKTALDTFEIKDAIGLKFEGQFQIKFNGQNLNQWTTEVKEKSINNTKLWRKVDVTSGPNNKRSYYDISAIYRQNHASGIETFLAFVVHDEQFQIEDNALSLIALSVHEIRTPLTIVRGYVDALTQDMDGKLDEREQLYLNRLHTSTQNLSTILSNVLNVVKADQNQLKLKLTEEAWAPSLTLIIDNLRERAMVRGKSINVKIADGLPTVALDKLTINEVITNLLENAIKYSPASAPNIYVDVTQESDGQVLTTIRDEGVGIPESVLPSLFTKFQRNHRNSSQVAGTGLGLFLSKAIVSAHHGNIWVKSKEGEGTTVGFTLVPFSKLEEISKSDDNGGQGVAHGWIKNHNMQRR